MPELLGKMTDGRVCVLKVDEGVVTLSFEKGLIGKSLVKDTEFKLRQTTGVSSETGVKPYKDSVRLSIKYRLDGEDRELAVFSRSTEKVDQIRALVEDDVRRREEALRRTRDEYRESRETQLNQLQLNLELAENLFTMVSCLHGVVDWGREGAVLSQVEKIEAEREALPGASARFGLGGLRGHVAGRRPAELKSETWEMLETLYMGVYESSRQSSRWFSRRYSYLLMSAMYRAWDRQLGSTVGEGLWAADEGLSQTLDEILELVSRESGRELVKPSGFESARGTLYEVVELLLGVELSLDVTGVDVG
jgi:hypothetical protein